MLAYSPSGAYLLVTAKDRKVFVAFKKAKTAESLCNVQLRSSNRAAVFLSDVFLLIFSVMMVFPCACVHFFLT